ncbi:MAG: DUF2063 domain-containing protein [Methylocella sp.]
MQQLQNAFAAALLDPGLAPPHGVISHTSQAPVKRFAVYRNNVMVSLIDALEARFPAAKRIVGEDFFRASARVFARAHPPRSPLMMTYGDEFPDFLETFEPAAEIVYLADVARIEAARTRAYHAADAAPLQPSDLAGVEAADLAELRFELHPSLEIIASAFPVATIWAMNAGEAPLAAIEDWRGEDALVLRPVFEVEVRRLPAGAAAFLQSLKAGDPLGEAAGIALASNSDFDLAINLAALVSAGIAIRTLV